MRQRWLEAALGRGLETNLKLPHLLFCGRHTGGSYILKKHLLARKMVCNYDPSVCLACNLLQLILSVSSIVQKLGSHNQPQSGRVERLDATEDVHQSVPGDAADREMSTESQTERKGF